MLFKYLFGGFPVMRVNGHYKHTTAIIFTPKVDAIQHRDIARDARLTPIAGGFCDKITLQEIRCYGDSISCNVVTFPRATADINTLWSNASFFEKQYCDECGRKDNAFIYLALTNGLEPTDNEWVPTTLEQILERTK